MNKLFISLFLFILFSPYFFCFNAEEYLLPNEDKNQIKKETFLFENNEYDIFFINDKMSFIVNKELLITDKDLLENIIKAYYMEKFYPKNISKIIEEVNNAIFYFNKSRSDGLVEEEFGCRRVLGENLPRPNDPSGFPSLYHRYAVFVCNQYANAIGCGDYKKILPDIESFFVNSYNIDTQIKVITDAIKNIDYKIINSFYKKALDAFNSLNKSVETIKKNQFRYPRNDDGKPNISECPTCYGICDELVVNKTALEKIRNSLFYVVNLTEAFNNLNITQEYVYNSTITRINEKTNKELKFKYLNKLNEVLSNWDALYNRTKEIRSLIDDKEYASKIESVINLKDSVYSSINNNKFEGLDTEINKIKNNILSISEKTKDYEKSVKKINERMKKLEAYYLAYMNDIDDILLKQNITEEKKKITNTVNGKIKPQEINKAIEEIDALISKIASYSYEKRNSLQSSMANAFVSYFKALYNLVSPFMPTNLDEKNQTINMLIIIFAVLIAASFSGFIMFVSFILFYGKVKQKTKLQKTKKLYFTILVLIVSFLVFLAISISSYLTFEYAQNKGSLTDFKKFMKSDVANYIVVKSEKTKKCSEEIAKNINATVLEMKNEKCYVKGKPITMNECNTLISKGNTIITDIKDPASIFSRFLGEPVLYLSLKEEDFEKCYISDIFK